MATETCGDKINLIFRLSLGCGAQSKNMIRHSSLSIDEAMPVANNGPHTHIGMHTRTNVPRLRLARKLDRPQYDVDVVLLQEFALCSSAFVVN